MARHHNFSGSEAFVEETEMKDELLPGQMAGLFRLWRWPGYVPLSAADQRQEIRFLPALLALRSGSKGLLPTPRPLRTGYERFPIEPAQALISPFTEAGF